MADGPSVFAHGLPMELEEACRQHVTEDAKTLALEVLNEETRAKGVHKTSSRSWPREPCAGANSAYPILRHQETFGKFCFGFR